MTRRVWAPRATRVDGVIDDIRVPMKPVSGGWWQADLDVSPGTDYGFSLDGEKALPDPRSAWQPAGVHGPSRLVDHDAFAWQSSWQGKEILGSVGYELHAGTFTEAGTLDAAITKLDVLRELGVDFVELMPVAAFPGDNGWGYDGVFPYAVQQSFGGPEALKRFVDACHERELAVILDVVYNHLGPDGNVLPSYGPYFTDSYATPWGSAVNYSGPDSDEVRRYFVENALMWLRDYRFDGLRLDAVHAIIDVSATHLLEELATEVAALSRELGRPLTLVAESDLNDPRIISGREIGGYGIDAQWSDDFHHALHAAITGETFGYYEDYGSLADLAATLSRGFLFTGQHSRHRRRKHGRPLPASVAASQLFGYAQNHDQVGNRARGERLCHLVSPDLAKIAATIVLTSAFTPMLFMGEEWAASTPWQYFTEHEDPQLAESVRQGRRNEFKSFGWQPEQVPDPQSPNTSKRSVLDWAERERSPHREMLQWYRDLIALRRTCGDFHSVGFDDVSVEADEAARVLTITRGSTIVACNLSAEPRQVRVSAATVVLASSSARLSDDGVLLPGESVAVLGK